MQVVPTLLRVPRGDYAGSDARAKNLLLDLYAGEGSVGKFFKKFGGQGIAVDRLQGADHDVLWKPCQDWLTWLVKTRRVRSVMLAVPCETCSRVRRGNAIVRSSEKTLGINNIDCKIVTEVREANRIWFFTYTLTRLLNAFKVPWCLGKTAFQHLMVDATSTASLQNKHMHNCSLLSIRCGMEEGNSTHVWKL